MFLLYLNLKIDLFNLNKALLIISIIESPHFKSRKMATQPETNNNNQCINTIKKHYSDKYIQELCYSFYEFIKDVYLSYCENDKKTKKINEDEDDDPKIISKKFINHLILQFLLTKGIRRKIIGDNIVLLSYDKSHNNYKADDNTTKLCRHLIFDTSCLRIISLGIPRRNNINDLDTNKLTNCHVEIQYDGSMVIYNPALKNNSRIYKEMRYTNDEDEIIKNPIDVAFSTRNKVGTSNFNSEDTFKVICLRNFETFKFNLEKLDNGFETLTYIFNVMDQKEHIANDNINLLVSCYQFKPEKECQTTCSKIQSISNLNEQSKKRLCIMFADLAKGMVKSLDTSEIESVYPEMKTPNKLNSDSDDLSGSTKLLKDLPYTYKGITIWDVNGARYKLANQNFEKIKKLRGNLPINLKECNHKSLFALYRRLKREHNIENFLSYFDTDKSYKQKFIQFKQDIQTFTENLHQWYLDVYVLKNKGKDDIPNFLYPLCYELHGIYLEQKTPIQKMDIIDYLYDIDIMSLYGRIYNPILDFTDNGKDVEDEEDIVEDEEDIVEDDNINE